MRISKAVLLAIAVVVAGSDLVGCVPSTPTCGPETPAPGVVRPEDFGATGGDTSDDTAALQRALNSMTAGQTLTLGACQVYRHSQVLHVVRDGTRITGRGTFLATNEERSSVWIEADRVTLDGGLTFRMASTTRRWDAWEQMKVRVTGGTGVVVEDVSIDGSAAAGLFVDHSSQFRISDVSVSDTRADGVHVTAGSNLGTITRPVVTRSGDDGVAVVSYDDEPAVSDVTVNSPVVADQHWGRGISVVGGTNITYNNIGVDGSAGAAVYIAIEPEYETHPTTNVRVNGGTVLHANTEPAIGHGAVVLYSSRPGMAMTSVAIDDLRILDTTPTAPCQVSLTGSAAFSGISLTDFTITGSGPNRVFCNGPGVPVTMSGWTVNGRPFNG